MSDTTIISGECECLIVFGAKNMPWRPLTLQMQAMMHFGEWHDLNRLLAQDYGRLLCCFEGMRPSMCFSLCFAQFIARIDCALQSVAQIVFGAKNVKFVYSRRSFFISGQEMTLSCCSANVSVVLLSIDYANSRNFWRRVLAPTLCNFDTDCVCVRRQELAGACDHETS